MAFHGEASHPKPALRGGLAEKVAFGEGLRSVSKPGVPGGGGRD